MPTLYLTEDDVRQLLPMELALETVETAFRKLALNEAMNIPRTRAQTDHGMLHVLSASAKGFNAMGLKAYATTRAGANFYVMLFDGTTGQLNALIEADHLGRIRTGAASGVATRHLARTDAKSVGLLGTGRQARTQLEAVCQVRQITSIAVYSRSPENRLQFAKEMSKILGVSVTAVKEASEAVRGRDIVITATSSKEPVLKGEWITDGTHLNVIGSNFRAKAEIDTETVDRASVIVVDSKEQAKLEAGDLIPSIETGSLSWADVGELSDIVARRWPGRESPQDVTLFKSLGIGIEDVACAARIVEKARAAGIGKELFGTN